MKIMMNHRVFTLLFSSLFAFLSSYTVNAQDGRKFGEIGFRFMPTFSSLQLADSDGGTIKGEVTLGYGVGGFLGFNFTDNIGVQAEVIYNSYSQKYTENEIDRRIKLQYVNIPLLISLNTGKSKAVNLNIVGGPQLGISVGSSLESNQNDPAGSMTPIFAVRKGDFGVAYGVGLDFGLNPLHTIRLGLGYRGVYGLVDISDQSRTQANESYYILDRTHIKTNALYVGLSILF